MKSKIKLFGIYLPIFAASLISAVTFRTVACISDLNINSGYFDDKTLQIIGNVIAAAATIFLITYIFKKNKDMKFIPNFTSATTYVPTGLVGIATVFMMPHFLSLANNEYGYRDIYGNYPLRGMAILHIITVIFAALSIVHFILTALVEKHSSTSRATFGLCTVIFLSLYAVHLYFDTTMSVNAPNKLIDELAYLSSALFFLYETRLSMGREKWKEYIAVGFVSSLLTAYSSIPALVTFFVRDTVISNNIYESALSFTLFIFITARILLTSKLIENERSSIVNSISEFAEAREAAISENDLKYAVAKNENEADKESPDTESDLTEQNENQLTIDDIIEENENTEASGEEVSEKEGCEAKEVDPKSEVAAEELLETEENAANEESSDTESIPSEKENSDAISTEECSDTQDTEEDITEKEETYGEE